MTAQKVDDGDAGHGGDFAPLTWYRAVLTQGWKRQLRRMFAAVEAPVERLVRVRIGTLRLDDLAPGAVRPLTAAAPEFTGSTFIVLRSALNTRSKS